MISKKATKPKKLPKQASKAEGRSQLAFHWVSIKMALMKLAHHPWGFIITCSVIALGLSLPVLLFLLLKNLSPLQSSLAGTSQISIFTHKATSQNQLNNLKNLLEKNPNLKHIDYITPKEALAEFKSFSSFKLALESLENNPLPGVFVVEPKQGFYQRDELTRLSKQLAQLPHVESVQVDLAWSERLSRFTWLGERVLYTISLLLSFGLILIIYNNLRLLLQHSKDEINIMTILGGTKKFIERPYLYLGVFYGITSGALSLVIVQLIYLWLKAPAESFSRLYYSQLGLQQLDILESLIVIVISIALSLASAKLTTGYYLKRLALSS